MNLILIFVGAVLVNNFVMNKFMGCCPFLGVSKKTETAFGMGMAVTFVITIASLVTYFVRQLLVALDFLKPATVREGVKWLPEKQMDVFFVTLNKADKDYSPTTMYHDYSINENLFHWQSQSTTAADSPTGQRYIHHRERGSKVLLFVREFKADRITGGAEAYTFLGTANYVKHSGSRPMNITWKLDRPIPAKFLKKTNKLVVG